MTAAFRVHPAVALLMLGFAVGYALARRACPPERPLAAALPVDEGDSKPNNVTPLHGDRERKLA